MECTVEMASDVVMHMPSFMTIGSAIAVILRLCLNNLRGCIVGKAEGRDLMKYAVEIFSYSVIYIPRLLTIS
jgi:hypothetical protein